MISSLPAGVGVPLMLTYVYGVVPMSLCRNGWCRPQSEPPETNKIQLEDLANCEWRTSAGHWGTFELALARHMSHFWISVILFGFKGSNLSSSLFHTVKQMTWCIWNFATKGSPIWWSFNFSYRSSILSCSQWPLDGSEQQPVPQRHQRAGSQGQCAGGGPPHLLQHTPRSGQLRGLWPSLQAAGRPVGLRERRCAWQQGWRRSGAAAQVSAAFVKSKRVCAKVHTYDDLRHREGTNIEVRVEIETHPRCGRQSSLSSILSSRSLSAESLARSKSQSQDHLCASEQEEERVAGGAEAGGTVHPVFDADDVWGPWPAGFALKKGQISWKRKGPETCCSRPPPASETGPHQLPCSSSL